MREILFRGKRCDNLDWVEGYLLKECNYVTCSWNLGIEYKTDRFGRFAYEVAEVVPYTIGQFTGLTDKNGKKIFEGDILDVMHQGVFECRWDDGNFEFGLSNSKESFGIAYVSPNDIFVIGNIHDNPELLEGSEGE